MVQLPAGARRHLGSFEVYHPGMGIQEVQRKYNLSQVVKLASNENMLGPSPRAREAILGAVDEISSYPDTTCAALRSALSLRLGVAPDRIFIGNGAVEIIYLLGSVFLEAGDEVVTGDPSFSAYTIGSQIQNALVRTAPLADDRFDPDALLERVGPRTKLVFVANPNNPTGTMLPLARIAAMLGRLPTRVILVLDEAYSEFVTDPAYHGSLGLLDRYENLVVLRSLSKSLGIAGLRVGYALAGETLIRALVQVQVPFHVNLLAQRAALAALDDEEHRRRTLELVEAGRAYLHPELARLGLSWTPSHTNFLWIRTPVPAGELFGRLVRRGCIVRPGDGFGCPHHIRVTIGQRAHNEHFVRALEDSLRE